MVLVDIPTFAACSTSTLFSLESNVTGVAMLHIFLPALDTVSNNSVLAFSNSLKTGFNINKQETA